MKDQKCKNTQKCEIRILTLFCLNKTEIVFVLLNTVKTTSPGVFTLAHCIDVIRHERLLNHLREFLIYV